MDYIDDNIHPCKGCIDYEEPDGCLSNGACGMKDNDVEYITKEEAISAVDRRIAELKHHPVFVRKGRQAIIDVVGVKKHIASLPAVDVAEVRHGRWEKVSTPSLLYHKFKCSECGHGFIVVARLNYLPSLPKYCQECGAKMDSDTNG